MRKKKLTNGEKRECRLRYLFRQLKRAGKIPKDALMKVWRGKLDSLITIQEKKPRKKRISSQPTKKQRRKTRKSLKAKFRNIMNLAKKARREARQSNLETKERSDPFKRLPRKIKKLYQKPLLTPEELKLLRKLKKERDHGSEKARIRSIE